MWKQRPEERLLSWREQRNKISTLSKEEAILNIAEYWSRAPISSQYLSADLLRDWPDPWTLIVDNCYDDISITLMMVYTLVLGRDDCQEFLIRIMKNNSEDEFHTAWFEEGKYIINYEYGEVISKNAISTDLRVTYEYNHTDLQINNYI